MDVCSSSGWQNRLSFSTKIRDMRTQEEKGKAFRELHERPAAFIIPIHGTPAVLFSGRAGFAPSRQRALDAFSLPER